MDCVVRQIESSEAELILPLLEQVQAIHAAVHPDIYKAETDRAELLAMLRDTLAKDSVTALVAVAGDGSVVGYATMRGGDPRGHAADAWAEVGRPAPDLD
jgi:hypothetical protein